MADKKKNDSGVVYPVTEKGKEALRKGTLFPKQPKPEEKPLRTK